MSDDLDIDLDLDALRGFRTADAMPPAGLQERVEETLLQQVLLEEARIRGGAARRASWLDRLLRPATAIGLAVTIAAVLAISTSGQQPGLGGAGEQPGEQSASLLDATAARLFGGTAASASSEPAIPAGGVAVRQLPGPTQPVGEQAAAQLPRDPARLRALIRSSAASAAGGADPTDRMAFIVAMGWVTDPAQPADVRAAFVRAMGGLAGIDAVGAGSDLFGRQGIVIGHVDGISGLRDQFVLQPDGGQLLERRTFTTIDLQAGCPSGTFTAYAAYDEGEVIDPASARWAAWPSVIEACDPGVVLPRG